MPTKRRHAALKIIAILILVVAASLWYVNKFVLPVKAKAYLVDFLKARTGREVTVGGLSYNLLRGLAVSDIVVYEDAAAGAKEFFSAKEVYLNLLILPFFREKKIIIPSASIREPRIFISLDAEKRWNFETLSFLKEKPEAPAKKPGTQVIITSLSVKDADILFEDKSRKAPVSGELYDLNLNASLSLPRAVKLEMASKIKDMPATINATCDIDLQEGEFIFSGDIKGFSLDYLAPYLADAKFIRSAAGSANITFGGTGSKEKGVALNILSDLSRLNLVTREGIKASGDAGLNLNISINPNNVEKFDYDGKLLLKNVSISGLPQVNALERLTGTFVFTKDGISTEDASAAVYDMPFTAAASLEDYRANALLSATIRSKTDIAKLKAMPLFGLSAKLKEFDMRGDCALQIEVSGSLRDAARISYSADLELEDGYLKTPYKIDDFKNISGSLRLEKDSASVKDLNAVFMGEGYNLNGRVSNFKAPSINAALESKNLSLSTRLALEKGNIKVSELKGRYFNSRISLVAEISDIREPAITAYGNASLELADLKDIVPKMKETFGKLDIKGNLDLNIFAEGKGKNWQAYNIKLKGRSELLSLKNMKFDGTSFVAELKENVITVAPFEAGSYDGLVNIAGAMDFNKENPEFRLDMSIENVDLAKLAKDTPLKEKDVSGLFSFKAQTTGYGFSLERLKGEGWLRAQDGRLFAIPLLRGMADIINIPELNKAVFRQAYGDFTITNGYFVTRNLSFASDQMSILADGSVKLADGALDFDVTTNFSQSLAEKTTGLGKTSSIIMDELGNFFSRIKITGTLSSPKYSLSPPQLDKIIQDKFKAILQGILK